MAVGERRAAREGRVEELGSGFVPKRTRHAEGSDFVPLPGPLPTRDDSPSVDEHNDRPGGHTTTRDGQELSQGVSVSDEERSAWVERIETAKRGVTRRAESVCRSVF